MTEVNVALAKIYYHGLKEFRINPFWFTTDHSINLNEKTKQSPKVILEKLSEKSLLELAAAVKLNLIDVTESIVLKNFLTLYQRNSETMTSAA